MDESARRLGALLRPGKSACESRKPPNPPAARKMVRDHYYAPGQTVALKASSAQTSIGQIVRDRFPTVNGFDLTGLTQMIRWPARPCCAWRGFRPVFSKHSTGKKKAREPRGPRALVINGGD
jgi:hypothetical protein